MRRRLMGGLADWPVLLVAAHAMATLLMVGLVWFVQIVHYPLFARVGPETFARYEHEHQVRTTRIVAPLMCIELGSAAAIAILPPDGVPPWLAWASLAMVGVVWALTFLVAVPLHAKLSAGFDRAIHRRLVLVNWPRTIAWTVRGGLSLAILAMAAAGGG